MLTNMPMTIAERALTKPGSRRDGDEACDDARGGAEDRRLSVVDPFDEGPGETCRGSGGIRHDKGIDREAVGRERASRVEAEPSEPEQGSAEHRMR